MGMLDFRGIGTRYREPVQMRMRFTGAGANVPTDNANCPDALFSTLTRSAAGTLSLNTGINNGWVQAYDAYVNQPTGSVGLKVVRVTPPTDGSYPVTLAMQVVYSANNANVDVAAGEELLVYLDMSNGKP